MDNIKSAVEAALFSCGSSVPVSRLSLIFSCEEEEIISAVEELSEEYINNNRGIRIIRLDDRYQMCSAPDYHEIVSKITEQPDAPALTKPALEVLSLVAYFQPVTRVFVDKARGIDSSYTVGMLCQKGLIEQCGRLEVPGRPLLYKTSEAFLRAMNISSLDELPVLPDVSGNEGIEQLKNEIDILRESLDSQLLIITDTES